MLAQTPQQTTEVFASFFNRGDIDQLIAAYYADGAVLAAEPGKSATGVDLRIALARYFESKGTMQAVTRHCLQTGDTALLVIDWVIKGCGENGDVYEIPGTSTDVVRRAADGTWRCIIDNPHGTT